MGIKRLGEIAEIFKSEGKHRLPVAVIQNGSMENEKLVVATVDTIAEAAQDQGIDSPAIIVFGDVVGLHPLFQPIRAFYEFAE
jgi:uroporphyrin-III C-methyltransferase